MEKLKISTFNCKNVKTSVPEVRQLCDNRDIVFLQETWLIDSEFHIISSIDKTFYVRAMSAMNTSSQAVRGRPYGGTGILWRKELGDCNILDSDEPRIMCLELKNDTHCILLINVYLPYDSYDNLDEFMFLLSKVNSIIENHPSSHACVIGDFNANTSHDSLFGKELVRFCNNEHLIIADNLLCNDSTFTFYSDAHNSVSWLDHVVVSENVFNAIMSIEVDYSYVTSDHFPMFITLNLSTVRVECMDRGLSGSKVQWDKLSDNDIDKYRLLTDSNIKNVSINHSLLLCDDVNCKNHAHISAVDLLYKDIKCVLLDSAQEFSKGNCTREHKQIAGWKEYCSIAHREARSAFLHWVSCGKPRAGVVFDEMRSTRAYFKLTLRKCRSDQNIVKSDMLAKEFLSKDNVHFWKEVNKLKGSLSHTLAFTVDSVSGQNNICTMWQKHYQGILNSSSNSNAKNSVIKKINNCTTYKPIEFVEVFNCVRSLKNGKSCGIDGLQSEHLKYATDRLSILLCFLFNAMIVHGYMCQELMDTILIPIIKDKKGNLSSKDNYRPIALTSVLSKVLESIVLKQYHECFTTKCNQFGFKRDHSTDLCTFTFKQVIDYYNSKGSPVFICYLDASKAFDKINFWILFNKLIIRGLPLVIVRLLVFWYTKQKFIIRWGSSYSETFVASNGVRQGGVLSPHLFNLYMDDLSLKLNSSKIGCNVNGTALNHLMYADDTVLIAPTAKALQYLILLCEEYAMKCEITFNIKKSVYMCIKPKSYSKMNVPQIFLNNRCIDLVHEYKYLGVLICDNMQDDGAINTQIRNLYARGNTLIKHFKCCTDNVKCALFKSYCSAFYCCQLWCNYSSETARRFKVAYNRIFRVLMGLEKRVSMSKVFITSRILHSSVILRKAYFSCMNRVNSSSNILIQAIINSSHYLSSPIFVNWVNKLYL